MVYSADGGASWTAPTNLTNSPTPGCEPGDCDSDHWSSLSPHLDSYAHLFYVNDKDAGGISQTEGQATDNPMLYYRFGNPLSADDNASLPTDFGLSQNYPNPFNAQTGIEFRLDKDSRIDLSVYDVTGAKVATIANRDYEAGSYSVNWDASKVASGVYYYTLRANDSQVTKKMTLLK